MKTCLLVDASRVIAPNDVCKRSAQKSGSCRSSDFQACTRLMAVGSTALKVAEMAGR